MARGRAMWSPIGSPKAFKMKVRRPAKEIAYKKRHLRLTSHDQIRIRRLKQLILTFLATLHMDADMDEDLRERLSLATKIATARYLSLVFHDENEDAPTPDRKRTIDSFSDSECNAFFRFVKVQLHELVVLFKFPEFCILSNGAKMPGEEVMLRGLYELASGENQHKIGQNVFGRDGPAQSRAMAYFIEHIFDNFQHLVTDNLPWWFNNGFVEESADAIAEKMLRGDAGGPPRGEIGELVAFFIDCNCLVTTRVGGGPAESGKNSARWDQKIQRSFYNGWKSHNGLKHQTVDTAGGYCVDIFGPTSLRRSDTTLFAQSDINDRVAALQLGQQTQFIIFGDSAYKRFSHTRSYYAKGATAAEQKYNRRMKTCRVSIEWNYGGTAAQFPYLCNKRKLHILKSARISKIYIVTTILRNVLIGYNGCQSSSYFKIGRRDKFVEKYLTQSNF